MPQSHISVHQKPGDVIYTPEWELLDAKVVERPNRFLVIAEFQGSNVRCHIHDPGRLRELIFPGNAIKIRHKPGPKTQYSVVCAYHNSEWVLLDSRLHPVLARKFLPPTTRSEVKVGSRRLDFQCDNEYIEVKGCTLVEGRTALFPDAPSIRAAEHLSLLSQLVSEGHACSVLILVLREKPECFLPNKETDPQFSKNLMQAVTSGVNVFILRLYFDGRSVVFNGRINLCTES